MRRRISECLFRHPLVPSLTLFLSLSLSLSLTSVPIGCHSGSHNSAASGSLQVFHFEWAGGCSMPVVYTCNGLLFLHWHWDWRFFFSPSPKGVLALF